MIKPASSPVPPPSAFSLFSDVYGNVRESFGVQVFYALGLAVQKGLPFLLIPVLIHFYGEQVYGSYVLFYASVQFFATLVALATPTSIVPLWYAEEEKASLIQTYVLFLLAAQLLVGGASSFLLVHVFANSFGSSLAWRLTGIALLFTLLYNFNTFLTGVCRARNYSKGYFLAQIIAATWLVSAVILFRKWPSLESLILVFLTSFFLQDLFLFVSLREYLGKWGRFFDLRVLRRILAYSLPLIVDIESKLFLLWVDKYLVRMYFPVSEFSRFAITFQYAFAQSFFAQIFAMHTFPLICQLTADRDWGKLGSVLRSYNLLLALLGVLWMGFVLLVNQVIPLAIDPVGFLLSGTGFLLWNLAGNETNALLARLRTKAVTAVTLLAGTATMAMLALGCWTGRIGLCYFSHVAGAAVAFTFLRSLNAAHRKADPPAPLEVAL